MTVVVLNIVRMVRRVGILAFRCWTEQPIYQSVEYVVFQRPRRHTIYSQRATCHPPMYDRAAPTPQRYLETIKNRSPFFADAAFLGACNAR